MNEKDFVKLVEECRIKRSSRTIHNASIDHAQVLFENLLMVAQTDSEEVRIVSGDLREDFYVKLTDKITSLAPKVKLIVLNQNIDLNTNAFAKAVKDGGGTVLQTEAKIPHFMLVGNSAFRLEVDHAQTKAVASFNNPAMGDVLKSAFDDIEITANTKSKGA